MSGNGLQHCGRTSAGCAGNGSRSRSSSNSQRVDRTGPFRSPASSILHPPSSIFHPPSAIQVQCPLSGTCTTPKWQTEVQKSKEHAPRQRVDQDMQNSGHISPSHNSARVAKIRICKKDKRQF
nr:uncharacterized protein LOC118879793 [Drosophila suzukii]